MWWQVLLFVLLSSRITGFLYPPVDPDKLYKYYPPENQVTFFLYHSSDLSREDEILIDDIDSLESSRFDPLLPTCILIHGWTHARNVPWLVEMREAMADLNSCNVIVVDWSPLSRVIYVEARVHTTVVSKQVSELIIFLCRAKNYAASSIHLIGHSMGAQISAYASYKVRTQLQQTIGRITGLDPAAPLYEWPHIESLDEVLDPSDATFVDAIHTNCGGLGMVTPAGHIDYYPNGGLQQPGCVDWVCSHMRSCEIWTASIRNPDLFKAYRSTSWEDFLLGDYEDETPIPMGIASDLKMPHGTYFLLTHGEEQHYIESKTTILNSMREKYEKFIVNFY